MEKNIPTIQALFEKAGKYVDTRLDLVKLQAVSKSSDIFSSLFSQLAVWVTLGIFLVLLSIGLALLVGELLGKSYYGFFVMAGIYGITGLVLHLNKRKWLKKPIEDSLIRNTLN